MTLYYLLNYILSVLDKKKSVPHRRRYKAYFLVWTIEECFLLHFRIVEVNVWRIETGRFFRWYFRRRFIVALQAQLQRPAGVIYYITPQDPLLCALHLLYHAVPLMFPGSLQLFSRSRPSITQRFPLSALLIVLPTAASGDTSNLVTLTSLQPRITLYVHCTVMKDILV